MILIENVSEKPELEVEYFVPDDTKDGGKYVTVIGTFR